MPGPAGLPKNRTRWLSHTTSCRKTPTVFSPRQRRLEGATWGTGTFEGQTFTRWQYEVTAGGRIFYFVDDPTDGGRRKPQRQARGPRPRRRVIVEAVHPGHPKGTERKNR